MTKEWISALLISTVGAGFDLRYGIIPNWLTFGGLFGGVVWHSASSGVEGVLFSLGGAVSASLLYLVPCLLGGIGWGDFKLMLALGALLGPGMGIHVAVWSAVAGGIVSAAVLLWRAMRIRRRRPIEPAGLVVGEKSCMETMARGLGRIYYGPVIAIGTAWSFFMV